MQYWYVYLKISLSVFLLSISPTLFSHNKIFSLQRTYQIVTTQWEPESSRRWKELTPFNVGRLWSAPQGTMCLPSGNPCLKVTLGPEAFEEASLHVEIHAGQCTLGFTQTTLKIKPKWFVCHSHRHTLGHCHKNCSFILGCVSACYASLRNCFWGELFLLAAGSLLCCFIAHIHWENRQGGNCKVVPEASRCNKAHTQCHSKVSLLTFLEGGWWKRKRGLSITWHFSCGCEQNQPSNVDFSCFWLEQRLFNKIVLDIPLDNWKLREVG